MVPILAVPWTEILSQPRGARFLVLFPASCCHPRVFQEGREMGSVIFQLTCVYVAILFVKIFIGLF